MRIISGKHKRRRILSVPGSETRPTSDRVRESLFNILGTNVAHKTVLDLFAGTGALGIESLSRGAKFCTFVDQSSIAVDTIKKNIHTCSLEKQTMTIILNIGKISHHKLMKKGPYDLIFMDPPYEQNYIEQTLEKLQEAAILKDNAAIIIEHSPKEFFSLPGKYYTQIDQRHYGKKTSITFLEYQTIKQNQEL